MPRVLEKVERSLGERLFLKGRCSTPKCALVRRAVPPGAHSGKSGKKRKRGVSEYGALLREKQKLRYFYGLDSGEVAKYVREAASKGGVFDERLLRLVEMRLDNIVFRSGFANSRHSARQLVGHGHFLVNGRPSNIPSLELRVNDEVSMKERALKLLPFVDIDARLKKYQLPSWISLDKNSKVVKIVREPMKEEVGFNFEVAKIKEFYSR